MLGMSELPAPQVRRTAACCLPPLFGIPGWADHQAVFNSLRQGVTLFGLSPPDPDLADSEAAELRSAACRDRGRVETSLLANLAIACASSRMQLTCLLHICMHASHATVDIPLCRTVICRLAVLLGYPSGRELLAVHAREFMWRWFGAGRSMGQLIGIVGLFPDGGCMTPLAPPAAVNAAELFASLAPAILPALLHHQVPLASGGGCV